MSGPQRVQVLPPELSNLIAAGEVVERPASVVKELVENSIDAGARRIQVYLKSAGRSLIQVQDDGVGMDPEDAVLALQRHATSKIREAGDLMAISSLGFRGEALTSIAAVSHLELTTRTAQATLATQLTVTAGEIVDRRQVGAPPGTRVVVKDLFFNTPARRQHLRKETTELARIVEVMQGLALGHPHIAFSLVHEGRQIFQTAGDGNVISVVAAVLGPGIARQLLAPQRYSEGRVNVRVYAGKPALSRANRQFQFFLVNGRWVRSPTLRQALEGEYQRRGLLMVHRFPAAIVQVELPVEEVDVNIHPTKQEVRFAHPELVSRAVQKAVGAALDQADLAPRVSLPSRPATTVIQQEVPITQAPERVSERITGYTAPAAYSSEAHQIQPPPKTTPGPSPAGPEVKQFSDLQVLGVIDRTYIIASSPAGMVLIDQHAAHERVVFEQLLHRGADGTAPRQRLAVPIVVELDAASMQAWTEFGDRIADHGFTGIAFGQRTVLLQEVPVLYRGTANAQMFRDLLDAYAATGGNPQRLQADLAQRTMAACKAAVKAHDPMTGPEIEALLAAMDRCDNPYTCPHGRPTLLVVTLAELERFFRRTG